MSHQSIGAARGSSSKKTGSENGTSARGAPGHGKSNSDDGTAPHSSPDMHPCHFCKELGHWCRDCPKCKDKSKENANVQTVSDSLSPTKIYVTAELNGEPVRCLLDSSCERSVIAHDLVPNASLTPSCYSLFAANKANLAVFGDAVVKFSIDGHQFEADVSVSKNVDKFLLESD